MTMAAPQGNDATLTAEAAAAGCWRIWRQWWWQKQRDYNDGDGWQQRLQCRLGIALSSTTATGATPTITATAATDRMTKIMMTNLEGGWWLWWWQQRLKRGGSGGGGSDNSGGRQQSRKSSSGVGKNGSCGGGGSRAAATVAVASAVT